MKYLFIVIGYLGIGWPGNAQELSGNRYSDSSIQQQAPCPQPVTWRIGNIDPRFDIDVPTLKSLMIGIGDLWSQAAGLEMLTFREDGEVAVNFIYTEKQSITDSEQELSARINNMKFQYYNMRAEYQKFWSRYQEKLQGYNEVLSQYEENMRQYREARNRWSKRDVIPREEDTNLKDLKKRIDYWKNREERELEQLNNLISEMREQSEILNQHVDKVNELIYHYRERFETVDLFHQGVYLQAGDQKKINIYQYENHNQLKLVLAHEVGHALGLKHVSNPRSVMYYLMEEQSVSNLQLTEEDVEAILEKCITNSDY